MAWNIILNILLFYAIIIAINIPASFLGLQFETNDKPVLWYQPPGFVIPIVWFVLFTLMGIARSILFEKGHSEVTSWIIALGVLCASYAFYTLGLAKLTGVSALWFGLIGNLVVIVFTALVFYKLFPISQTAAFLILPVIIWTSFATLIVLGEMRVEKLI